VQSRANYRNRSSRWLRAPRPTAGRRPWEQRSRAWAGRHQALVSSESGSLDVRSAGRPDQHSRARRPGSF